MKFFISGQIDDTANVRQMMDAVKAAGHTITHDWTRTDVFLGGRKAKLKDPVATGHRAAKDIRGVVDCDVYVLASDNAEMGKGMYVELGAALALSVVTGKPRVYVVGVMNYMSVFYLHPAVIHKERIEQVLADLSS